MKKEATKMANLQGEYKGAQYPEGDYPNETNQSGYSEYPTQYDQYSDDQQGDSYVGTQEGKYPGSGYTGYDNKGGESNEAQADNYGTEGGYSAESQDYLEQGTYTYKRGENPTGADQAYQDK
jgi:hypothetical protein